MMPFIKRSYYEIQFLPAEVKKKKYGAMFAVTIMMVISFLTHNEMSNPLTHPVESF